MTLDFPTRAVATVWHTGTLDPADKRRGSYEGAGLSVSVHPDEWEEIARGRLQGTRHKLTCPDGRFLDALRLRAGHRAAIQAWAIARDLVRAAEVYRISWYNDELEARQSWTFASAAEARRESDGRRVRPVPGLVATPLLRDRILGDDPVVTVVQDLAPVYAEDVLGLDGTWWMHRLDVLTLTAPCGVIAPSRLGRWAVAAEADAIATA